MNLFEKHSVVFASTCVLILAVCELCFRLAGSGHGAELSVLAFVLPFLLGSTGLFLAGENRSSRYQRLFAGLGLFLTTPASNFYCVPIPFFPVVLSGLFGGPGLEVISESYWSVPWRTGLALVLIICASAGLSVLIAICSCRIANRLGTWTTHAWLLVFPLFLVVLLVFQFAALVLLLIVRALGLYPFVAV